MAATSSQGQSFGGIACTNIKHKWSRPEPVRLESSTLSLAHGSEKTYEDGIQDGGPGADANGITETVTIQFLTDQPPAVGDTVAGLICTESETEYAVGELVKGTATFVTNPS